VQTACARAPPRRAPRTHLLAPRAIRYCVRFRPFLYSRKLLVIRARSAELARRRTRPLRRGYCVGSTRHGSPTTTSTTAIASRIAPSFAASLTTWHPARPLLRARTGRHALDTLADGSVSRCSAPGGNTTIAVKKLRIVALPVLQQNIREVRRFHFCSTSVAV
jgi:hypothetical protein